MSSLRQYVIRPEPYLGVVAVTLLIAAADGFRPAGEQVGGRWYAAGVGWYQSHGRPVTEGLIRCPYRPTCSEYSLEAVRRYGLYRGMGLTIRRLVSCRSSVPPGTFDPPPVMDERDGEGPPVKSRPVWEPEMR